MPYHKPGRPTSQLTNMNLVSTTIQAQRKQNLIIFSTVGSMNACCRSDSNGANFLTSKVHTVSEMISIIGSIILFSRSDSHCTNDMFLNKFRRIGDVTQTVTKKFQFVLSDSDFERLVVESFAKLLNDEVTTIKFLHTLTVKQREIIHEKAIMNGLKSKNEGTRFRVLYLFKDNREVFWIVIKPSFGPLLSKTLFKQLMWF
jgi:hypothetical protein